MTECEDDFVRRRADAIIEEVLARWRDSDAVASPDFKARLLAAFDDYQRRRSSPFALLAEAVGWRALARPVAAGGVLAGLLAAGYVAGAAAAPGDSAAYAELAAAIDESFGADGGLAWDGE